MPARLTGNVPTRAFRSVLLAVWLGLVAPQATPARATDTSTALLVSATVLSLCLVTATPILFGNYDPTAANPTDASSLVTAICTPTVDYTITMDKGTTAGATVDNRAMTDGSDTLNYELYQDAARTTVWGDGTASTAVLGPVTATGLAQIYTVYGRIPTGQFVPSGLYTDTVTVTLSY